MFLARNRIKELALRSTKPIFYDNTFDESCVQQSSYDLRLGESAYLVGEKTPVFLSEDDPYLTITPGQFALLTSLEKLDMPSGLIGFITLKNGMKMEGLVNISGFHVDPTFKGNLIFAVNNAGPSDIRVQFGKTTFTIFFAEVNGDIGESRGEQKKALDGIPLQFVQNLGGSSVTLTKLQKEIDDLRTKMLIYAPLAVAALVALLISLIRGH
jgi:dCTP deaminase